MSHVYDIGDRVRVQANFLDLDGDEADPSTVSLTVLDPSGNPDSVTPTKESTGVYYHDVDVDEAGRWRYRFEASGTLVAAEEGVFVVRPRRVT